ncbi:MAG: hypothetical protein GSR72_02775 [Desulfurococcales archaeon]|nr:hypothetical protein [Desulfurococcales archaeon]MEB3788801.1 hypothetical protein [Desulfurococcales archaeon]
MSREIDLPPEYYEVRLNVDKPVYVLGGVETIALRSSNIKNKWILSTASWKWPTILIGYLDKPPVSDKQKFLRRITGGPIFDPKEYNEPHYTVVIGPRIGKRPIQLTRVYEFVHARFEDKCHNTTPALKCVTSSKDRCVASVGKLLQRPLIEFFGDRSCIEKVLDYDIWDESDEELDIDLILRNSLQRHLSEAWLRYNVDEGPHVFSRTWSEFYIEVNVSLEPPLITGFDLYSNMFLYPPAQARLLIDEMIGAVASRVAGFEFVNAWNGLVEYVGVEPGDFKDFILGSFRELERLAGLE